VISIELDYKPGYPDFLAHGSSVPSRWFLWVTDGCIRLSLPNRQRTNAPTVFLRLSIVVTMDGTAVLAAAAP